MVMNPKQKAKAVDAGQEETKIAEEHPVVGIDAISAYLGHCSNWVIHRRQEYGDFPVEQDNYTRVWYSTEERLDAWRKTHSDLFTTRKERLAQRADVNPEMRPSAF